MKIGFIGLGIMGKPMVRNLLKADHQVWVHNRSRQADIPVELNVIEGSYHGFDSDIENPFVQQILTQRVHAMAGMLADKKNKENTP